MKISETRWYLSETKNKKQTNKPKKRKKKQKKTEEKPNSATIIISVDDKGTVFPVKLKLQGESFE